MPDSKKYKFENTLELVELVLSEQYDPSYEHIDILTPRDFKYSDIQRDSPVNWIGSQYLVDIPVENILFMDGNEWNFEHAAALYEGIQSGDIKYLEVPAARVYRITASDIKSTQKHESDGDLEEQMGMVVPWEKEDIRTYWAQLLDGNHRALAAIAAGADTISVYVSGNYRDEVYKKDYL